MKTYFAAIVSVVHNQLNMMISFLIVIFAFVEISLIAGFPISDSNLDSCDLFDPDPSCSSNVDYSSGFLEADSGDDPLLYEAIPDGDSNPIESTGQLSLTDDLTVAASNTDLFTAGDVNQGFPPSSIDEIGSDTDSYVLFDSVIGEPTSDPRPETGFSDDDNTNLASTPQGLSYICQEFGNICQQFIDGVPTHIVRYVRCTSYYDTYCTLCDATGKDCDPDVAKAKDEIPSPDCPNGQPWNKCRSKICRACTKVARLLGFLPLGVISGCGPVNFDR